MGANNEPQSGKTKRDLLNGVHILDEKPLANFQTLADSLLGTSRVLYFPPVEGLIEASTKMIDRAEAGGKQHELPMPAVDLLRLRIPGIPEGAVQEIETRVSGHTISPYASEKRLKVLLLSLSPEKQIVDVLNCLRI